MKARHEFGTTEQWYDYLRTYFASQALIGLQSACNGPCGDLIGQENIARMSVTQADLLLKELQK